MFRDASFAMTLSGFDDVMASMDEAFPNEERQDLDDAWASVMSCLLCGSLWKACTWLRSALDPRGRASAALPISCLHLGCKRLGSGMRVKKKRLWYLRGTRYNSMGGEGCMGVIHISAKVLCAGGSSFAGFCGGCLRDRNVDR